MFKDLNTKLAQTHDVVTTYKTQLFANRTMDLKIKTQLLQSLVFSTVIYNSATWQLRTKRRGSPTRATSSLDLGWTTGRKLYVCCPDDNIQSGQPADWDHGVVGDHTGILLRRLLTVIFCSKSAMSVHSFKKHRQVNIARHYAQGRQCAKCLRHYTPSINLKKRRPLCKSCKENSFAPKALWEQATDPRCH